MCRAAGAAAEDNHYVADLKRRPCDYPHWTFQGIGERHPMQAQHNRLHLGKKEAAATKVSEPNRSDDSRAHRTRIDWFLKSENVLDHAIISGHPYGAKRTPTFPLFLTNFWVFPVFVSLPSTQS
jgi:hypothetical protein